MIAGSLAMAAAAILFHRTVFALVHRRRRLFVALHAALAFTGSLAILCLGGLLLLGRLIPPLP